LPKGNDDRARHAGSRFPEIFRRHVSFVETRTTGERLKERAMLQIYVRLSNALEGYGEDASGVSTIEYTLIASIISIGILVSVALFGHEY